MSSADRVERLLGGADSAGVHLPSRPLSGSRCQGQQFMHKKSGFFGAIHAAKCTLTGWAEPPLHVRVIRSASSVLDNCSKGNEGIVWYK